MAAARRAGFTVVLLVARLRRGELFWQAVALPGRTGRVLQPV